jgi:hypothetical protein
LQAFERRRFFVQWYRKALPAAVIRRDGRTSVLVFISLLDAGKLPEPR